MAESFAALAPIDRSRVDFVHFNQLTRLASAPPHPLAEYSFQVVQLALRDILSDQSYFRLSFSDLKAHRDLADQAAERIAGMLREALRWNADHGLLTFVMNFLPPQQNPMGRLLPRSDPRNFTYLMRRINDAVGDEVARYEGAYVLDIDEISACLGRRYFQDDSICALNHGSGITAWDYDRDQHRITPVERITQTYGTRTLDVMRAIWAEAESMFRTVQQLDQVKLVIVDIDDTLWRGLVLEQQTFNLDTTEGWPLGFVECLLFLKKRGVLLAIASKNDQSRVEAVWDEIWLDRIKLEDFAFVRINWKPKAENVAAIIAEAGLLPKSVVFIDDNPVERASIEQSLPGVRVLGRDPYLLRRILLWSSETQVASVTEESVNRTELVRARAEVEKLKETYSREKFLETLGLTMDVFSLRGMDDKRFARTFELINKTNQFNTTGRRLSMAECNTLFRTGTFYVFEIADRFSRYGLVGVVIVNDGAIEQFVMSCRVIGLDIEKGIVAEVCARLRSRGAGEISASLVKTDANGVCRSVYADCGFEERQEAWVLPASMPVECPQHLAVTSH